MARRGENIHKRKDGRWEGRYIKARTPDRRICWGYIYGTTYAEVKQRLIHKKSEYGGFQLIDAHLTFTELAEAWLWSVKCGLKESTYAHYQYTLYKYVLPILGTVPILRLEENILDQALQKIIAPPDGQHKELGFSSARECLSMVRRICKYAVHLRLIRPMELSVRLPQEKSHSMTPLSVVEQNRLRTYVLSNPTPRKLGLLLGIESGLRIGEVCGLKWDDFDLKTGTVQIKRAVSRIPCGDGHTKIVIQTPKTRTSRREIPLSKHMVQALKILQKSYPSDAWFLSGNTIKPVEPRCYRKSISAVSLKEVSSINQENVVSSHAENIVFEGEAALKELFSNDTFANYAWNKMYKRDLFEDVKFPVGRKMEDLGTTYKLLLKAERIAYSTEVLYYYFQREDSILHKVDLDFYRDKFELSRERYEKIQDVYPDLRENDFFYFCVLLETYPELVSQMNEYEWANAANRTFEKCKDMVDSKDKIKYFLLVHCGWLYRIVGKKK